MRTFKNHLKEKLKKKKFQNLFNEESELTSIALKIQKKRLELGLTQAEVTKVAKITQQQLSKVENGINCNLTTLLKICNALGLQIELESDKKFATG